MALSFYYLSGSPFAWRVWLALEYKNIPYELHVLSRDKGELQTPEYRAINPRGRAPAIVHDGFALYESMAILEYLEETFQDQTPSIWPCEPKDRAIARRTIYEMDAYLFPPVRRMVEELLIKPEGLLDASVVETASNVVTSNLEMLATGIKGKFFHGNAPCAVDFCFYPLIAMLGRLKLKNSNYDLLATMPENLKTWKTEVENLPYFSKTLPPHWKTAA
ncbi:MAG: glutathione S-transferase family protein [Alphaproteobacteria bacterium]|nr:glutathione S-transferase family protein [Alphaproteobacteria bacterium]